MAGPGERQVIGPIAPLFIVARVADSVAFYERLGFALRYAMPGEDPFFAIVGRDSVEIHMKAVVDEVAPLPNPVRHEWVAWDAFVFVADPDALAAEFTDGGVALQEPLAERDDGLHGFKIRDADGYVLFFGRPV